ncbi:MAG: lipopolysaccharide biosynthesis protein [Bacteroidota bacterium]
MSDNKDIKITITSKVIGLLSSFGLVIFSTKIWGSEGRGYISILLTDAALVAILSNILAGSSAMYHMKKFGQSKVLLTSIVWIILTSLIGSATLTAFHTISFVLLFVLSFAISFHTLIVNQLFAVQNFSKANMLSVSVQLLFVACIFIFWQLESQLSWKIYFFIQIVSSIFITVFFVKLNFNGFPGKEELLTMLNYGWRNELSYLFQFLSYRLSYFFIYNELGVSELGVFGVVIIIAESIWIISRSISTVLFAKQINEQVELLGFKRTQKFAKYSLWISLILILTILCIPNSFIISLFTKDFISTKKIFGILAPGILAIAVSNIYGHFFAAEDNQSILIKKSIAGFLVALVLTPLLLSRFGVYGATIAMSLSYLVSSCFLFIGFNNRKKEILQNEASSVN